ncbi:MAG: MFS transporter [Gammaproteobacteria bacterium]|nr:MFS transporter [Gammaproteobacteria bacterium]
MTAASPEHTATATAAVEACGYPSSRRAWIMVAILMVAYVISFIDRQILNLLVAPVRRDLQISDTQMSYLLGLSFALFYTVCGIPIGRLADVRSRRGVIAVGLVFWSLMTAGCGMARSYLSFLLFRVGVGVGEATLSPSAYSLIADSFPQRVRATAISLYSSGIYIGSGLAFLLGGLIVGFASAQGDLVLPLLGAVRPWQLVFLLLGAIGLVFSLVILAIREPLRHGVGAGVEVPLHDAMNWFRANRRTLLHHHVGVGLVSFAAYGGAAWVPSFLIRNHGWDVPSVGIVYGGITALFGSAGIVFGGRLADRLLKAGFVDAGMRVCLIGALLALPCCLLGPLMASSDLAVLWLMPTVFGLAMPFGVAPAAIQDIMPNALRSQASALYLFVVNLIGLGLGPTAVALCTDYLFGDDLAVRYSLALALPTALAVASLLLATGLPHYRASVERLKTWRPSAAPPSPVPSP